MSRPIHEEGLHGDNSQKELHEGHPMEQSTKENPQKQAHEKGWVTTSISTMTSCLAPTWPYSSSTSIHVFTWHCQIMIIGTHIYMHYTFTDIFTYLSEYKHIYIHIGVQVCINWEGKSTISMTLHQHTCITFAHQIIFHGLGSQLFHTHCSHPSPQFSWQW